MHRPERPAPLTRLDDDPKETENPTHDVGQDTAMVTDAEHADHGLLYQNRDGDAEKEKKVERADNHQTPPKETKIDSEVSE